MTNNKASDGDRPAQKRPAQEPRADTPRPDAHDDRRHDRHTEDAVANDDPDAPGLSVLGVQSGPPVEPNEPA